MSLPKTKMAKMGRKKKEAIFQALDDNFSMLVDECDIESPLTTAYKLIHLDSTPMREKVALLSFITPYLHERKSQVISVNKTSEVNININHQAINKLNEFLMEDTSAVDDVIEGEIIDEVVDEINQEQDLSGLDLD